MPTRSFFRAHGLGNDYLVWEGDPAEVDAAWVRRVCDRHTGVGSDGVLVAGPPTEGAEVGVRILNPDGSEAEKSGNGVRIFALWWARRTADGRVLDREFVVATLGGLVRVAVREGPGEPGSGGRGRGAARAPGSGARVRASMGVARLGPREPLCGVDTHPVDIGNPHRVVFGIPTDWPELGARVEAAVPGRTNVQFIEVVDRARVRARIWERGAGRTLASGSSASAIARVVTALGLCDASLVVEMEGGDLAVVVDDAGGVSIDGAIVAVGRVELDPGW